MDGRLGHAGPNVPAGTSAPVGVLQLERGEGGVRGPGQSPPGGGVDPGGWYPRAAHARRTASAGQWQPCLPSLPRR